MSRSILIAIALLILCVLTSSVHAGPELIKNPATPQKAGQTISLQEVWRAGSNEDVFFGEITSVLADGSGQVWVLDSQQKQVFVLGADGELKKSLSREGEGPGEVVSPVDIFFSGESQLGIVQEFPAQFVFLKLDGTPAGQITIPSPKSNSGGFPFMSSAGLVGGKWGDDLIVSGGVYMYTDNEQREVRFVSRFSPETKELVRFHEDHRIRGGGPHRKLSEREDWFPGDNLYCTGHDGKVYLVPERDEYRIETFDSDGGKNLTIERDFVTRKRDDLEYNLVFAGYQGAANQHQHAQPFEVEVNAPDIESIHISPEGLLHVQHSRSYVDQPSGVLLTYDVYGADGRLLRQLSIECDGDARRDSLIPLSDGRWIRISGAVDARYSQMGAVLDLDEDEEYKLEVICYEVVD